MKARRASDFPELDTSHFLPWSLDKLYAVEPGLRIIADRAASQKRRRIHTRISAYTTAKKSARNLVGWYARDPRLRSSEAWDCFFANILDKLRL